MPETQSRKIVVIGGGPAGVFAAIEAKRTDPAADVLLLTDEACEPYEKPPLSKAVLTGKALPEHALIAGRGGIAAHNVVLEQAAVCTSIDRPAREVVTASGRRFRYDALVLATGSLVRELPQLPLGMPRVRYLRTEADARALAAGLRRCRKLIVVGGGLIGLEAAASAAELGVETVVLEVAPRILARVCDEQTGAFIADEHRRHGVDIRTGTAMARVQATAEGIAIDTKTGETFAADLAVVGTGVKPNDALAAAAGLATDNGIVVDEHCRTADAAIFAAGDAVSFPRRARAGSAGELAPRPGPRRGRRPQRRGRQRSLSHRAVVLVGTIRPLHSRRGLAGAAAGNARPPAARRQEHARLRNGGRCDHGGAGHQRAARSRRRAAPHRAPRSGRSRRAGRSWSAARRVAEGERVITCLSPQAGKGNRAPRSMELQ